MKIHAVLQNSKECLELKNKKISFDKIALEYIHLFPDFSDIILKDKELMLNEAKKRISDYREMLLKIDEQKSVKALQESSAEKKTPENLSIKKNGFDLWWDDHKTGYTNLLKDFINNDDAITSIVRLMKSSAYSAFYASRDKY